jgi:uncharacterized cupin superfamily protein
MILSRFDNFYYSLPYGIKMKIILVDNKRVTPDMAPLIRTDLAWELFLPGHSGDLPEDQGRRFYPFANWLWDELGMVGGYLNKNAGNSIFMAIPELSTSGKDFIARICSMWADDIFIHGKEGHNLWVPPLVNVFHEKSMDNAEKSMATKDDGGNERYFMPLLGPSRSFFRLERISPGNSSARLHGHSVVDEYYLLMKGKATLKIGTRSVHVDPGTLVGKPTGPDLSSQFIADRGEEIEILDMEIWPDRYSNAKDVVFYPEHGELLMRGTGWRSITPWITAMDTMDFRENYDTSYKRNADGTWSPAKFQGHKERKK